MWPIKIIQTAAGTDLSAFSAYLWQQRVPHRIYLDGDHQVVELSREEQAESVQRAFDDWRSGRLKLRVEQRTPSGEAGARGVWTALQAYPALSVLIGACLVGFPIAAFGIPAGAFEWMTIAPLTASGALTLDFGQLLELWTRQFWRPLSPIFLHFSWFHLGFNCALGIWLGRRIESGLSGVTLWGLVLLTGLVGNLAQLFWSDGVVFGGLSGVVYGMLGFLVMLGKRAPTIEVIQVPPAFTMMILISLVLFSTGVTELADLYIANAAHWGGLLMGALAGALWPLPETIRAR